MNRTATGVCLAFGAVFLGVGVAVFSSRGGNPPSGGREAPVHAAGEQTAKETTVPAVLNFTMNSIAGTPVELKKYQGKVVLIVNTASECGLTPQYEQLQALHEKYAEKGLAVLGFPANDFGGQEPGSNEEIAAFCNAEYAVTFDMYAKVVVTGDQQCGLYKVLTSKETNPKFGGDLQWNFEKFLINRKGEIVARFGPKIKPEEAEVVKAIEAELAKK